MVALTGADLTGTSARVRAKRPDGTWGPWYDAETLEAVGPDDPAASDRAAPTRSSSGTTTVQIAVTRPAAPPRRRLTGPGTGLRAGQRRTAVRAEHLGRADHPAEGARRHAWPPPTAVTPAGAPPNIIGRAQWGADEGMRCGNIQYDNGIRAGIVHHTAGSNDYAPEDSAGIVRSIYAYHTRTLGWCDIAYNALVDKYGQVFEGRAGGITKPVEGSHTGGFNRDTWGVAMIGDFDDVPPTPIQFRTIGQTARLAAGPGPTSTRWARWCSQSAGSSFSNFPAGATPTLPTIFTHRDVGNTDCPGNAAYAAMDQIRDIAARFNDPPGPRTSSRRCAAARSSPAGSRWAG